MNKTLVTLMILLLCMNLFACGKREAPAAETDVTPVQSHPATERTEATEPVEPTGQVETYTDEKGNTVVVSINPDGSRTETHNYPDGRMVSIYEDPATGAYVETEFSKDFVRRWEKSYHPAKDRYTEVEWYENGSEKRASIREPSSGFTSEQEYYENGNRKWIKTHDPETEREMQYNEEGYCIYSRCENHRDDGSVYYKIECFGDETGKLIRVIENGEEITDEKFLSERAGEYHFRK